MHSSAVDGFAPYPARRVISRDANPILKVALAAIALISCVIMTAAFPPALILIGGFVVTALFVKCLYDCGRTVGGAHRSHVPVVEYLPPGTTSGYHRSRGVRNLTRVPDLPISFSTSPSLEDSSRGALGSEYTRSSRSSGVNGRVSHRPGATPTTSGVGGSSVWGALGSEYTRSSRSSGVNGRVSHRPGAAPTTSGVGGSTVPPSGGGGSYYGGGKSSGALGSVYTKSDQ